MKWLPKTLAILVVLWLLIAPDYGHGQTEGSGPVAIVHMDCDLYASSKTVLELIGPRLVPGTVMVFDDYFNYPNWQAHEFRAFQELVGARRLAYDYVGFTARGGTVLVKITGAPVAKI